jgi:hypothetical protein
LVIQDPIDYRAVIRRQAQQQIVYEAAVGHRPRKQVGAAVRERL